MKILITGGTGSLGNALTDALLTAGNDVVVLSRDEWKQAVMAEKFAEAVSKHRLAFYLGDVRDEDRLKTAFRGVDAVVHAAALKRVDAVAGEPLEVMKTNVLGTANVLSAARSAGVPKTLLISTDKACEPTNAYGASKFMAEQLVVSANTYGYPQGCVSSVLRYGNVLGSRGSVIRMWQDMITKGDFNPRITDLRMTRFLIVMEHAVGLVQSVLGMMQGGEVFVPRLPRARIVDIYEAMFYDVPAQHIGLRPGGEKLHETLLTADEARRAYETEEWAADPLLVVKPHVCTWRRDWRWKENLRWTGGPLHSSDSPYMSVSLLRSLINGLRDR